MTENGTRGTGGRRADREINIRVGRRIRQRRQELAVSREELAAALGISAEQLRRCETGNATVVSSRLHQIGVSLAVPASYFFEESETGDASAAPPSRRPAPSTVELGRLIEWVRRIADPTLRTRFLSIVAAVAKTGRMDGVLPISFPLAGLCGALERLAENL
jgi:transcriptional regulator with XRE-family HTH domain